MVSGSQYITFGLSKTNFMNPTLIYTSAYTGFVGLTSSLCGGHYKTSSFYSL